MLEMENYNVHGGGINLLFGIYGIMMNIGVKN